ncbi:unnamed protein product [Rotaria socialis]|uniref:Reverse transcriptase domain-containing protein n=1 Tax=Rotaria socialis TaxID=392032 RepID=A0A820T984_9BILA|nr:unnamed protein product [Rotaria socialis]
MKDIEPTCSLEEHAKKIEQAIKIIVEATVPAKITTKKPWISEETLKLADEKRRLKQLRNVSLEYAQQYKGLCRKVKRSARQDKEHWIQDQCEQAEKGLNIGNTREAYGLIKMLRKEFVPRLNVIRNQEGTMLQTKDDIKRRWTQYCSSLYKDPGGGDGMVKELEDIAPPGEEVPQDILYSEVQAAINSLKRNKSPGSDGITAEMLQAGGEPLSREIHKLCNKAWHEGTIPEEWGKSILVPIPKKGDLSNCSNYRTISLINHTGKVLLIVLLNRLKTHLDPYLSEEQAGFRKDRSTVHQILTLRLLAEKAKRQGKKIYNCFIDFQKAFDTIKHKIIWAMLKSYGVDTKMVTLLQKIYEKSQSAVRIGKDNGEWFRTDVGTRQGDPLSPLLFIAYLERVMDQVRQNTCGINISGILINNLRFADDIDLIDEDVSSLQQQIELTKTAAEQAGLILNINKTKTMLIDVTQLDIPLCNTCYRYYSRQMRAASINATDYSMESDFGGTSKTFANASSQTEDSNVTILTRSDSVNMIVDTPATIDVTASVTTSTVVSKSSSSVASPASISFCCLPTSHGRCSICHVEFSCNSSTLVSSNDVRAPAFLEHDILIVFGSRCCVKHIDSGYLNAGALQRIRNNENKCYLCVEEFVNIFTIVKNEFLLKASTIKELNNAPPLNFDDLTSLTSDNYYVLTGLNRVDFDDLCSRIPSPALRSTHNRSARTAIACLLMKLRLGISNQVLATLFSFNDKRTVSHVVHSARKVLVEYFVPNFLGFEHIKRRDVINLHTRPLASELLAGQSDRAILILDGTYIYCQKSANNLLQRRTYSMHKGRPLVKPMLITTTTGYIVSCMGPYFADYKNNDAEITKHIIYLANRLLIK